MLCAEVIRTRSVSVRDSSMVYKSFLRVSSAVAGEETSIEASRSQPEALLKRRLTSAVRAAALPGKTARDAVCNTEACTSASLTIAQGRCVLPSPPNKVEKNPLVVSGSGGCRSSAATHPNTTTTVQFKIQSCSKDATRMSSISHGRRSHQALAVRVPTPLQAPPFLPRQVPLPSPPPTPVEGMPKSSPIQ